MTAVNDTIILSKGNAKKTFQFLYWINYVPCYLKNKSTGRNMSDQLDALSFSTRQLIKTCCNCGCYCAGVLFIKEKQLMEK